MFERLILRFSGEQLLNKLCDALADLLHDPDFLLSMEFELEALRNEKLRTGYAEFAQQIIRDGLKILEGIRRSSNVRFAMDGANFVIVVTSLVRGLAARQALLGSSELSYSCTREMVYSVFNCTILHSG